MKKLRSQVRNAELDGFSDTLVRLFKADEAAQEDVFLKATMETLETLSAGITTAILQDKTFSSLEARDSDRDDCIRSLGAVLSGYASMPIAAKKEAAEPLKAVYDKYAKAGIISANYRSESSMIESMLEDFAAASLSAHIEALEGTAEAIAAIRAAQDAFNAASDAYAKANANKGASASSYNKPIVSLVNDKLLPYLDAMVIAGNEGVSAFAKAVEDEITRLNEVIAKRGKKAAATDEDASS